MKLILLAFFWLVAAPPLSDACPQDARLQDSTRLQEQPKRSQPEEITHSADTLWVDLTPDNVGAAFSMPKTPKYSKTTFDKVVEQPLVVHKFRSTVNNGTASFIFVYNDLAVKMDNPKVIRKTLDGAVLGANARVLGTMQSDKKIRHGSHKGREFVYAAELNGVPYKFSTQIILVNQRLYQLILVMTDDAYDEKMVRKYFDSFKLNKIDGDSPPKPTKSSAK